ncbi:MAG: hypothetical protein ACI9UR_000071 [Bacteroidia bacterium]|jgi:hypothetical protein
MKSLETRIRINASVENVWNVFSDFQSYPEWNPFVIKIDGKGEVGQYLTNDIKMEGSAVQTFKPLVLVRDENKEFRWKGKLFVTGLFDGEHYFQLKSISENETEFIHGEIFSGVLVALVMSLIGEKTKAGFEAMNTALKNRVENLNA